LNSNGNAVDCGSWGTIDTSGLPDCTGTYDADLLLTDPNRDCVLREADLPLPPSSPRSWLFEDYPSLQLIPQQ